MQHHVTVFGDEISGFLNYVTGFTQYDQSHEELQSGNYLALKFAAPEGATVTVELSNGAAGGPVTLDSDMNCVFRVTSTAQTITVVVTGTDGDTLTRVYKLNGLTLRSE